MQLSESLVQAEVALKALSEALVGTDANALQACSTDLRDAFMALAVLSQQQRRSGQAIDAALQQRMDAVGSQLAPLREQLVRASAMTGHKLATLLPAQSASATYDALSGRATPAGPARIYRSAG